MNAVEPELLRSMEVATETGISYRMIDFYTRRGFIQPVVEAKGSGTQRLYDPSVVDELRDLRRRIEACPFHPHDNRQIEEPVKV